MTQHQSNVYNSIAIKRTDSSLNSFVPTKPSIRYINLLDRLQSIGKLSITDLDEFLIKSKIDFDHLYKDKTVHDLKLSDFKLISKLGSGSFGKVVLAEYKRDQNKYAIKVINKKAVLKGKHFRYIYNEKRILQSINFPFVIYLKYFFVDFTNIYIVMPFVPCGDFFYYLQQNKPLSEPHAKFYICQVILALEYLHYLDLIHRDVKPENIMLDIFGYIKLGDFGQCLRVSANDRAWTFTGTPEYMAPEIIRGKGYDCSADWWSLGVMTFEFCAGHRPFKHQNTSRLYKLILNLNFSIPKSFSRPLEDFVRVLITLDPSKRLANASNKALLIKAHTWVKDMEWLDLLNRTISAPYIPQIIENYEP